MHPPDFTEPIFLGARSDDVVVKILLEKGKHPETAHSAMVMAGVVKESSLRDAVHYARTLILTGIRFGPPTKLACSSETGPACSIDSTRSANCRKKTRRSMRAR